MIMYVGKGFFTIYKAITSVKYNPGWIWLHIIIKLYMTGSEVGFALIVNIYMYV